MKKTTFYTMIRATYDGQPRAIPRNGYTDEKANYYKAYNHWYAIEKQTGYALADAATLKQARAMAWQEKRQTAIKNFIADHLYLIEQFTNAVQQAQAAGAVITCV